MSSKWATPCCRLSLSLIPLTQVSILKHLHESVYVRVSKAVSLWAAYCHIASFASLQFVDSLAYFDL